MTARIKDKLVIGLLQFLCIFFCFGTSANASQIANDGGRVLFISSYSYAWNTVQIQIDGIENGLGANTVLDFEFMNTKRLDTEESRQLLYDRLEYMFSMLEPYDVIILGDDAALQFALENRDTLFKDIPLVFEGVNDEELALRAMEDPLITGVIEKQSLEKNIDLGLMLIPDARKVVAVLDNSITGEAERKRFYSYEDMYPNLEFTEINASILTTTQLRQAIYAVSTDSILIYISMVEDLSGKQYSNKEAIELLSSVARTPVLRMVEGGIGEGLLGGNIVSMYRSGEIAAQTAMEIIGGKSVSEIPMMESPNIYNIDADVMEKYDIDLDVLPPETEILNAPTTFIERNREALIPGLILIGVMILVILWFVFDNQRRRKLMKELEEARRIMESASQHDFLTGLPNRNKFMNDLSDTIQAKRPCTVMMMDIDDFKKINDTKGHTAGDEALQQVAGRLKEMGSQILTPYRFAGDEFIVILQSNQGKIVEKAAYQMRQIFSKPFVLCGEKSKICGSIGIASYPKDTEDMEQLIVCADDAMYQVKKSGKNDFAFYKKKADNE
ncbi:MAG: diguanylate cyclase [Eubacterium sp.]|nr:diguanylate cyclase [Eubacterium sp.]MCM1304653.1 diguanylate cyclase [Butyrivibrio sp.]MCM1344479.1 diguanylate cyclase [Muribaculaceae bacterium]MCM1411868.1 diguanylate cyclase [Lachnospiraceae bacterium]